MLFPTGKDLAKVGNATLLRELLKNDQLILRRKNGVILVGQELEVRYV
jgi:hypothetical protein